MPNKNEIRTVDEVIADARALLAAKQIELDELEQQAQLNHVRGTRELAPLTVRPAAPPATLLEQVAEALTTQAQNIAGVAATLGVPVGKVLPVFQTLRDGLKIHNIGSEVEPCWQHVLPADCATADLRALVLRLISDRPFTHRELVIVTGANENRISGVLAKLRADEGARVTNLGNGARGKWFVLPAEVPVRRSSPRRTTR